MLRAQSCSSTRLITSRVHRPIHLKPGQNGPNYHRYATHTSQDSSQTVGLELHGFRLRRIQHVPELQLTALDLLHKKTGAEYLHIDRDDKNNVFCIGFKTNPPDATGVPHILEHTTLCGSQRYPVRDPFFKMLRRSLSNFMNAYTHPEHTSYPFATNNRQDFKNLMSVYLDATLHPLLREHDFLQEGWRVGPAEAELLPASQTSGDQASGDLTFKGVVYNEMKGQLSDASYLFYTRFQEHILPALGNAGGDPKHMTDLSYDDLKTFHKSHYHPSNARIFTYGNLPWTGHAQQMDNYLNRFSASPSYQDVKEPIDLEAGPLYRKAVGPIDTMLDPSLQSKTSTSWVTCDTSNLLESFSMGIISSLLLDGYGSPLYQALIESGIGLDFTPNTGFDTSSKKGIFSVGVNGVRESDVSRVKEIIQETLQEVSSKGFDKNKINGILQQLELSLKHKTADFGMSVLQRLETGWFNGVDPMEAICWNKLVQEFQSQLFKGSYLEGILQQYLLNDKSLTFVMESSPSFHHELAGAENKRLDSKINDTISDIGSREKAIDQFRRTESALLDEQMKAPDENLSSLPTLTISDISRTLERKGTRDALVGPVKVQWREAATNGLSYFRAVHKLAGLSKDLRMLLPLFSDCIMRLGTKSKSMEELEDLIKLKTGGISIGYHSSPSPQNFRKCEEGFSFAGYSLDNNVYDMYWLLRTLIQETDFDNPESRSKILQLIRAEASGASDAIAGAGHSYAMRYAQAGLSLNGQLTEQISGMTHAQEILKLSKDESSFAMDDVISKLKRIQSIAISNSGSLRAAITCGIDSVSTNEKNLVEFLESLPQSVETHTVSDAFDSAAYASKTFFPLPYQVYYSGAALPTASYVERDGAALQIASQLLTHRYLHHEIREKGGAYGGGAFARGLGGVFGFHSYRDPNPQNTLRVIGEAGRFVRDKDWTEQDLQEAKLSTFQSVDAPQSVSDEGMTRFVTGIDESMEQVKREQLLDVAREDIRDVAQKYLVDGADKMRTVVIGEKKGWVKSDEWKLEHIDIGETKEADV